MRNCTLSLLLLSCLFLSLPLMVWAEEPLTPTCSGDVAPGSGDRVVNVNDLLAVINAWGACPAPCPPCAADTNNDCQVNVNDLLTVINNWGVCPCPSSGPEPNETCAQFVALPNVGSNQTQTFLGGLLHDSTDIDIYRIRAAETDSTCSCCDGFCTDEDFRVTIRLSVPASSQVAYQMCLGLTCGNFADCITVLPGQVNQRVLIFDGSCAGVDQYDIFVRLRASATGSTGCVPYTLQYTMETGCFGG